MRRIKYDKVALIPDWHAPYHHEPALATAIEFVGRVKPRRIIFLGDGADFYQVSKFAKDPQRKLGLQDDLDANHAILRRFRDASPGSILEYLCGNHEARMRKYLWGTESPLTSLRGLSVPELLRLKDLRCGYVETGKTLLAAGSLIAKHGNIVRAKAGASAMAELERAWLSGVSGHTHRLATVYRRNESGSFVWIEAGCLCNLDAEYLDGQTADWQHGLVYGEIERDGNRFLLQALPIVNGRIIWGGEEVEGRGAVVRR